MYNYKSCVSYRICSRIKYVLEEIRQDARAQEEEVRPNAQEPKIGEHRMMRRSLVA